MQKYNLTNPQKSIWFTEEIFKGTPIENITGTVLVKDKVDFKLLEKAINIFVQKNDSFRLKFVLENGQPLQYVSKYVPFDISIIDVSSSEDLKKAENDIATTAFDINDSLLFVYHLVRFPDGHGGFIINMHHLISDAWSAGLGGSEIIKIYTHLLENESIEDISYPSYVEYINSEQEYFKSARFEKDKLFWNSLFETVPEVATIPASFDIPKKTSSSKAIRKQFVLPLELLSKISDFTKNYKISIFNFFMAVFAIYIGKISGLEEVVLGSPILNRSNAKEKRTSGMFISTVPLRVKLDENIKFADLASTISTDFFNIFKHQKYSYLSLLEDLRKKDNTIPNLYKILISYQNIRSTAQSSKTPFDITWIPNGHIADDIDIHIYDMNDTGNINIAYDYLVSKYTEESICKLHTRILNIIEQILSNNDIDVKNIEIITPEEKNKLLVDFNDTTVAYDTSKTISMLFEEQALKTPDNIALVFEDKELTYKELNEKSNSLARFLRSKNIGRNDIVGIMVNRSLEMIISILAVLKAGGTYIPIDPEYPQDRIEYMLNNSNAKLLLTFESLKDKLIFENKIFVDLTNKSLYSGNSTSLENINKPNDSAYIIYTSGSTGMPKGVVLTHKALTNLTNYSNNYIHYLKDEKYRTVISITTVCFDIFIFETLISLQKGLKLVIANEDEKNLPNLLNKLIKKHKAEIIQSTPSRMQFFVDNIKEIPLLSNLNYITLAGEQLPISLVKQLREISGAYIYNGYGPSETTVFSTLTDVTEYEKITIGKPLYNTKIYILDKKLNIVPINAVGELYIAGDGLGKGYLNNPELTAKSFIPNPFTPNTLMYKTGDLGYFMPNGEIMCLGRSDNQVKIRGLRVELGEIETCILTYPGIDKCAVIVNNEQKLLAFFSSEKNININDLKAYMQRKLPTYFIPNSFVPIEKFKLTPNGKLDRKALHKIKISSNTEYEEPKTDYQKKLAKIFEKTLGISKISINDNFFEIGGDSLSAIKLQIEAINEGFTISYKDIFSHPTIKALSQKIQDTEIDDFKEDYDYSEINKLIEKNKKSTNVRMTKDNIKNILLTGATGFMGIHILDYLLKHTKSNIYCLIRAKNNTDPQSRLLDVLHFYFGDKYDKLIFKRIFAVEGDISKKKLGLNDLYYNELGSNINCIINSAAIVKHYGKSNIFNDTNVAGVQNLIDFSLKNNCKFLHLSTLSVSGNIFNNSFDASETKIFTEKNLYINQDLSNIYVKTKFLAERLILENIIKNNLNAKIIRLGNITNRYSDGLFQINVSENAFLNRIHSFIQIGCIPESLKEIPVEFSPVDICADAIVNLAKYKNNYTIFHVFNKRYITFGKLVKILHSFGIHLEFITDDDFNKKILKLSKNSETKNMISGIVNDISKNGKIQYVTNIKMENNFTNSYLKNVFFKWQTIDEKYIKKYVAYLKSIGYIR